MIEYIQGDLFAAIEDLPQNIIIPHIVNDIGAWGSGFVIPLGRRFPKAEKRYREIFREVGNGYKPYGSCLGSCSSVKAEENRLVCNMVAQRSHKQRGEKKPIRYFALMQCMETVKVKHNELSYYEENPVEIHAPKFGSDRAGGNWELIEALIEEIWEGIPVKIYYL